MTSHHKPRIMIVPMLPTLFGRRYQVAKHLAQDQEVHFITWEMPYPFGDKGLLHSIGNAWKRDETIIENIHVHKVRRLPFFFPLFNRLLFRQQIRAIFNENKLDVVISQSFFSETEPPRELPLYFDYNDDYSMFAKLYGSKIYKFAYKILRVNQTVEAQLKRARGVFAVSSILEEKALGLNKSVYKLPNGIDHLSISETPRRKNQPARKHSLVYVSTFGKWSQLKPVIEAVNELKDDLPDIHLHLIGDGTELAYAKRLIQQYVLGKYITVTGRLNNRAKLFEIVRGCEVCLNISDKNAYRDAASPIKVFEYTALGKKIVSTDLAEVLTLDFPNIIIHQDHGEVSLADTIKKALYANVDTLTPQRIVLSNYTWDTISRRIVNIINDGVKLCDK